MQQTEKYKLNLIESSDPFLPEGLNATTQKVEEVLLAADGRLTEMTQTISAFDQRLGTHGHNARVVHGTYTGNGKYEPVVLTFDFFPVFVIVCSVNHPTFSACRTNKIVVENANSGVQVDWTDNSVSMLATSSQYYGYFNGGGTYYYMALGYDPEE